MSVEGNKNAESITRETALDLARRAYDIINDDCYSLSDITDQLGIHRRKFNYILKKFIDDEEVEDAVERVYNKCESLLVKKGLTNKVNPIVSIFILKSYHGLKEVNVTQHEVDVNNLSEIYKKALSSNENSKTTE